MVSDLAVLAAFFNPCSWKSSVANFRWFHERLRMQGVEPIFAEVAFDDAPFALTDLGPRVQVRTRHVLWQRERLVNHLITLLPSHFTKIAWLDTDLVFGNERWREETSRALDRAAVVQPFRTAVWLDPQGNWTREKLGFNAAADLQPELLRSPRTSETRIHPGFAWAARRDILERHGVPDFCIVGGNDSVLAHAAHGILWPADHRRLPPGLARRIRRWAEAFYAEVRDAATWIDGHVYHLWHGDLKNRQYHERHLALRDCGFDPDMHIAIDAQGAWRWTTDDPATREAVMAYFRRRKEDGEAGDGAD